MAVTLKFKRGLASALPASAQIGEPLFATDTKEFYIGTGSGKEKIGGGNPSGVVLLSPGADQTITGYALKLPSLGVNTSTINYTGAAQATISGGGGAAGLELENSQVADGSVLALLMSVASGNDADYRRQCDIRVLLQGGAGYQRGSMLEIRTKPNAVTGNPNPRLVIHNCGVMTYATNSRPTNDCLGLYVKSGTDPSSTMTDCFAVYAKDQAAGNACPHFMTENGAVVKLYQRAHVADPSGGSTIDSQARTAINAILATLEALGFHATS